MRSAVRTRRNQLLITTTHRLLIAISVMLCMCIAFFMVFTYVLKSPMPTAFVTLLTGTFGGFIGIQRRLRDMSNNDLELLVSSWGYTILSPLVGGILAIILYCLFLSGLISGALFPSFQYIGSDDIVGFQRIFEAGSNEFGEYGKLIVWSFIAGFSERFVVNILGNLESRTDDQRSRDEEEKPDPIEAPKLKVSGSQLSTESNIPA